MLVIEPGINRAFETWGRFLTDLAGKRRPPNGADVTLNYLGYWTDHGTQYYYNFEPELEYAGTLLKIRDEFRAKQIRLGYVQLDSWFYPKGHEGRWQSADGGTYLYEASRDLFPEGLAAFQRKLGMRSLPTIAGSMKPAHTGRPMRFQAMSRLIAASGTSGCVHCVRLAFTCTSRTGSRAQRCPSEISRPVIPLWMRWRAPLRGQALCCNIQCPCRVTSCRAAVILTS